MNLSGNKVSGVATTRNLLRSRSQLILMMCFGVIHAWEMKDGKKWVMVYVQYNLKGRTMNMKGTKGRGKVTKYILVGGVIL